MKRLSVAVRMVAAISLALLMLAALAVTTSAMESVVDDEMSSSAGSSWWTEFPTYFDQGAALFEEDVGVVAVVTTASVGINSLTPIAVIVMGTLMAARAHGLTDYSFNYVDAARHWLSRNLRLRRSRASNFLTITTFSGFRSTPRASP
jgi:hypothetical protein